MTALAGKTAVVTGATGAIAQAAAVALARDGASVVIAARRAEGLADAARDIAAKAPGTRIETVLADCQDEDDMKAALQQAHGIADRLDIIVSTLGSADFMPLLMLEAETLRRDLDLNIVASFLAIRHGAPLMERGGSIVCVSSTSAIMPFGSLASYCVAKAGLEMLVKCAAEELGAAGIRVNAVRPGLTRAPSTSALYENPGLLAPFLAENPLGRVGEPDDIAGAIRYLAGPEASWVTGQSIAVDGGNELRKNPDLSHMVSAIVGPEAMARVKAGKEAVQ